MIITKTGGQCAADVKRPLIKELFVYRINVGTTSCECNCFAIREVCALHLMLQYTSVSKSRKCPQIIEIKELTTNGS